MKLYRDITVTLPSKTRQNGTLFLHVILASDNGPVEWKQLQRDGPTVIQRIALTDYVVPKAAAFNLLGDGVSVSYSRQHLFDVFINVPAILGVFKRC